MTVAVILSLELLFNRPEIKSHSNVSVGRGEYILGGVANSGGRCRKRPRSGSKGQRQLK